MLALFGYRLADAIVRTVPAPIADRCARTVGAAAYALRVPARRRLEANLARWDGTMGTGGRREVRASFELFGIAVADFLRLGHVDSAGLLGRTQVRGWRHLQEARRSGRGVIVLTAHIGSWEWGAAWLAAQGPRLHVVARPHPHPGVERFFRRRRARWGIQPLDGRPLWVEASRVLRDGDWVALMGDRAITGFEGSVCAWAGVLARRTGAVILPAGAMRLPDGSHRLSFGRILTPEACIDDGYRRAMQAHIRRAPGQWYAFAPLPEGLA